MLYNRAQNGNPSRWRIFNAGVSKMASLFRVPGHGCGMNWQWDTTLKRRDWTSHSLPLSSIVEVMDEKDYGPAFLKIDCDGCEVDVLEAVLDLLPSAPTMQGVRRHHDRLSIAPQETGCWCVLV